MSIFLTDQEISRFMKIALVGIKYWCESAIVESKEYRGMTCDALAAGYILELHDIRKGEPHRLTKSGLIEGLELYASLYHVLLKDNCLDFDRIDESIADQIIQYAVFGEPRLHCECRSCGTQCEYWNSVSIACARPCDGKCDGCSNVDCDNNPDQKRVCEHCGKEIDFFPVKWGACLVCGDDLCMACAKTFNDGFCERCAKIRTMADQVAKPRFAVCKIRFNDDNVTNTVTIALYDRTPDEDDETVYYTNGIEGLISLIEPNKEDFIVTDVLSIE